VLRRRSRRTVYRARFGNDGRSVFVKIRYDGRVCVDERKKPSSGIIIERQRPNATTLVANPHSMWSRFDWNSRISAKTKRTRRLRAPVVPRTIVSGRRTTVSGHFPWRERTRNRYRPFRFGLSSWTHLVRFQSTIRRRSFLVHGAPFGPGSTFSNLPISAVLPARRRSVATFLLRFSRLLTSDIWDFRHLFHRRVYDGFHTRFVHISYWLDRASRFRFSTKRARSFALRTLYIVRT